MTIRYGRRLTRRTALGMTLLALTGGVAALVRAPLPAFGAGVGSAEAGTSARQAATPAPAQAPAQIPPAPRAVPAAPGAPAPGSVAPQPVPTPVAPTTGAAPEITQGVWLWQRTEYNNDTTLVVSDPSKYSIALQADGRLSLQADCNRGTGTYTLAGPQITLVPGAMTLAACAPGSQDTVFLRELRDVVTYVFDGQNLVLNLKIDGGNMIFAPEPPASLTSREWRVTGINNGRGGVVSVLPDVPLTVQFGDDGNVSGNSGCNMFRGPYTVAGSTLSIGDLISTRRACISDALNAQEQQLLAALAASTTYQLAGDRLTLRDASGAQQVGLVRPAIQPTGPTGP